MKNIFEIFDEEPINLTKVKMTFVDCMIVVLLELCI